MKSIIQIESSEWDIDLGQRKTKGEYFCNNNNNNKLKKLKRFSPSSFFHFCFIQKYRENLLKINIDHQRTLYEREREAFFTTVSEPIERLSKTTTSNYKL